jgi:hypothetical protein
MTAELVERNGDRLLFVEPTGPLLGKTQDLLDLIEEGLQQKARVIVVPVARLDPAFFQLRSGLAGEFVQKIVNYRFKLAVIGDISARVAESNALRDFVRECNRGGSIFFLPDIDALDAKLSAGC